MKKLLLLTLITITFCIIGFGQTANETAKSQSEIKMTSEDLIARHLRSIGSAETLATVKSRVMVGNGKLTSKIGYSGQLTGPAQFASEGNKVLFALIFNSNDYPYEKGAYNGEDITVGLPLGKRSLLGDFLKSHSAIFKQGLLGGVLSSAWLLSNGSANEKQFEYEGLEKVKDRQLHKLKYTPAKGGTLRVNLYFDTETFRHLMTEYQYVVSPSIGPTRTANAVQREQRYTMVETFSDFAVAGKLTMPQSYHIDLTVYTGATQSLQWEMRFSEFYFNEQLPAEAFKVS